MININVDFFSFHLFILFLNCNYVWTRKLLDVHCALDFMEWNHWLYTIFHIDNTNMLFLNNLF
jgi:hypothetical protein